MNCIAVGPGPVLRVSTTAQRRATDPEIAILQLSHKEHAELHQHPKEFVNGHHVFDKDVNSMEIPPHASGAMTLSPSQPVAAADTSVSWLVIIRHRPDSSAAGACVAA